VTGRVRTLVYNPARVKPEELPKSVLELTAARWKGRVGWAPQNASFQVFVTGLRVALGEAGAETWLREMVANQPKEYPKNGPIVQAVAAGAIDLGLVNHYYLLQLKKQDPSLAAENHYTQPRDPGSLVNLAAFAIPRSAGVAERAAAEELGRFLLSDDIQRAFAAETHEYPLVAGIAAPAGLKPLAELESPMKDLGALHDLEGTLALLRKTAVLP
jgi:iron(III) transport system substrate-binding protein